MPNDNWIFLTGFIELIIACLIYLVVLRLQLLELQNRSRLQRLKWLLVGSVVFLFFAAIPLMTVYADALWIHATGSWLLPFAVIGNATSKMLIGVMLYLIYKFKE